MQTEFHQINPGKHIVFNRRMSDLQVFIIHTFQYNIINL